MSKQIEALKLALEVFDCNWHDEIVDTDWADKANNALTVMREALEKEALHKLATESLNEGLRLDDWDKIGCVNHDCGKCKALAEQPAQQEPVAKVYRHGKASNGEPWHGVHWFDEGVNMPDGTLLYTAHGITKGNT